MTSSQQDDSNMTKLVAKSAEKTEAREKQNKSVQEEKTVTMSNGVIFTVKKVPQVAYADLRDSLPEPTPPIFYNEDYDREEPNVNDPRYLASHSNWQVRMSTGVINLTLMFGSDVKYIPDDIPSPESDEFKEELELTLSTMGWEKRDIRSMGKKQRYLFWVKYKGAVRDGDGDDGGDLGKLINAIGAMSGVPEEDVATAVEKFRD